LTGDPRLPLFNRREGKALKAGKYALIVSSIACAQIAAPHETVLGPVVRAGAPEENIRQVWVHADPTDGQHLIACGSFSYPELNVTYGFVYSSSDGGANWRRTLLDDSTRWVTEPSCTYGSNGEAYFAVGESDTSTGAPRHQWGHLQLFASRDRGMSWKRAGRRAQGWMDWTMLAAIPKERENPASLVIFANSGTDELGHRWEKHPVALEVRDGAQVFSALTAAPVNSDRNFSGGSVVLPDRSALFISGTTDLFNAANDAQAQMKVFAYSAVDRKLQIRAVLRQAPRGRLPSLRPGLAQDVSGGRFHKRLYAAWTESSAQGPTELWLAISDDNGHQWSSRVLLSVDPRKAACPNDPVVFPDIRIALNRNGVLGVLWSWDAKQLLFAASSDGGRTFHSSVLVASHTVGEPSIDDAIPYNEWFLAESLAGRAGKSPREFVDLEHLGLSVRLSKPFGLGDFSLAADAKNIFHAVWAGLGANGIQLLTTRTIATGSAARPAAVGTHTLLTNVPAATTCTETREPLNPPLPVPRPLLKLAGQREVTQSFNLQIVRVEYTPTARTVSADVVLVNKGAEIARGPLSLFAVGLHSDYGAPVPLNASGLTGGQPFWDLSPVIPAEGLQPQASSKPLKLRFKLDHFRPVNTGDAVAMLLHVFSKG
jgi:hypothetical protein